jgi:hypothetical protein
MKPRVIFAGFICWVCLISLVSAQQKIVPLYGRFEKQLIYDEVFANPFRDVVLDVMFDSPSGRKVPFFGFYDGDGKGGQHGNVWTLRFMPDEVGRWLYTSRFSDGKPAVEGSFVCVKDGARPGPLHIDGKRFVQPDKQTLQPWSYYYSEAFCGDWTAVSEDIESLFAPKRGFNWCCTTFWQGPLLKKHKWNALPFNGFYPILGGDYTTLDLHSWRHVDEVLNVLEKYGVIWFNFDGFVPNVGGTMSNEQRVNFNLQKVYVRNAVARLAAYWNVTWNIAFEWNEFMEAEQVAQLVDYVHKIDPWKHPVTVHDQGRFTSGEEVMKNLHVDFVTLQYDAGRCGEVSKAAEFVWRFTGKCPVYAQEVTWEGPDKLDGDGVRRGAWGVAMAGGIVNYAEQFDRIYGNGQGARHVAALIHFFESTDFQQMSPHNELGFAGTQYVLAQPGRSYIAYASKLQGKIGLKNMQAGVYKFLWFDCAAGSEVTKESLTVAGGDQSWDKPDGIDDELAVCIKRVRGL